MLTINISYLNKEKPFVAHNKNVKTTSRAAIDICYNGCDPGIRLLSHFPEQKKIQHVLNSYTGDYLLCQTLRTAKDSCKNRLRWDQFTFGLDFSSPKIQSYGHLSLKMQNVEFDVTVPLTNCTSKTYVKNYNEAL